MASGFDARTPDFILKHGKMRPSDQTYGSGETKD